MTKDTSSDELEQPAIAAGDADLARFNRAGATVKGHVIASMALGLVPVPVFDLVALMGVQLKMVHSLCKQYDVKYTKNIGKSLIGGLIAGVLPITATVTLSSMLKVIPGFGSLASGASVAILGGALTYGIGRVFVHHFESGGTMLDFSVAKYRDRFKKEVENGKSVAADLRSDASTAAA